MKLITEDKTLRGEYISTLLETGEFYIYKYPYGKDIICIKPEIFKRRYKCDMVFRLSEEELIEHVILEMI